MKLKTTKKLALAVSRVSAYVEDGSYITLEDLSERLNLSCVAIHRAMMKIGQRPGWSFQVSNKTPYWRSAWRYGFIRAYPRVDRGREKGVGYDLVESDWSRTSYFVRKPL